MPAEDALTSDASVTLRAYEPEAHRAALWVAKTDFETALGDAAGDAMAAAYADKLTEAYRERWLAWVDRCVADRSACVTVAERQEGNSGVFGAVCDRGEGDLVGYVFVLRSGWRTSGTPPW
jgi:hypothetical protein